MPIRRTVNFLPILSCLTAFCTTPGYASPLDSYADETPTEFNFYLSRQKSILDNTRPDVSTTTEWVGFSFFSRLNSQIEGGLLLGYSFASQENAALTAGMNLSGAHLGVALRIPLIEHPDLRVSLDSRYVYQNVDDNIGAQSVRLVWHTYDVGLSIAKHLTPLFGIYGGILYGSADGTETASGTLTQTRSFKSHPEAERIAGIFINSGLDGSIGIYAHSGLRDGIDLVFTRRY